MHEQAANYIEACIYNISHCSPFGKPGSFEHAARSARLLARLHLALSSLCFDSKNAAQALTYAQKALQCSVKSIRGTIDA